MLEVIDSLLVLRKDKCFDSIPCKVARWGSHQQGMTVESRSSEHPTVGHHYWTHIYYYNHLCNDCCGPCWIHALIFGRTSRKIQIPYERFQNIAPASCYVNRRDHELRNSPTEDKPFQKQKKSQILGNRSTYDEILTKESHFRGTSFAVWHTNMWRIQQC